LYNELLKRAQALVEKELPYMRAEKAEDAAENAASAEGAAKQAASEAAASAQQAKHAADRAEAAAKKPGPTQ
jgi:hypothetical protein